MRLVILGPPSSGKGTQASMISDRFGIPHLSTGDILREEVSLRTDLGVRAEVFLKEGELVPDDLVVQMMKNRLLRRNRVEGFVLDGFPRTIHQLKALDKITTIDKVLFVEVKDEEVIARAVGRRICQKCGRIYHMRFDPPEVDEICDVCGSRLIQRDDDKEATIKRRLRIYRRQTVPLIKVYEKRGILVVVDGNGTIKETKRNVLRALAWSEGQDR